MKITRSIGFALLMLSASVAFAQEKPSGMVVYAEGREFSVIRGGEALRFTISDDKHLGFVVADGDLLQTGASTFVEVQLKPKGTMLKIAENSSFVFQTLASAKGETNLNLLYGRVRAKVAKISGTESFSIRSRTTSAGVRGTDFGFDSILSPSSASGAATSAASVRVYAFSGELAVAPVVSDTAQAAPTVSLKAGELLAVDTSSAVPLVERRALDEDVKTYWRTNEFKGTPPIAPPEGAKLSAAEGVSSGLPSEAKKTGETEIRYSLPDYRPYKSVLFAKNAAIGAAIAFNVVGFAVQAVGASFMMSGSAETGSRMMLGGGALVGVSIITLVSSLLVKTPSQ